MAIARKVINAQLSLWCHCKVLGLAFCCFKYVLSGVNSYLTIEIEAIPGPSQKVPKNEEFWMNEQFTFGDFASNFLLKTNGGFEACITQLFFISVRPFFLCFFNHYTFKVTIFRFLMLEFVFELLHWNVSIHSKLLVLGTFWDGSGIASIAIVTKLLTPEITYLKQQNAKPKTLQRHHNESCALITLRAIAIYFCSLQMWSYCIRIISTIIWH